MKPLQRTHHNHTILAQQRVEERFTKEHSVCHVKKSRPLLVADILETNCVSNLIDSVYKSVDISGPSIAPTSSPSLVPTSVDTRAATDVAEILRGCVQATT